MESVSQREYRHVKKYYSTSAPTSSNGIAEADRSFKDTPKSSRADMNSPTAETVEANAIRLLMLLFGNAGNSTFCETLAA